MHSLLESSPVRGIWWNPTENTVRDGVMWSYAIRKTDGSLSLRLSVLPSLEKMEESCETALRQIDERMYAKEFKDSYDQVLCYGIFFL